jgi:hypothetical protein
VPIEEEEDRQSGGLQLESKPSGVQASRHSETDGILWCFIYDVFTL